MKLPTPFLFRLRIVRLEYSERSVGMSNENVRSTYRDEQEVLSLLLDLDEMLPVYRALLRAHLENSPHIRMETTR